MSDYPCSSTGYVMSTSQLNDLWHYDMWLGNCLMDLPLRKCTAIPKDVPEFPPMESSDYERLRNQVRAMWITASQIFTCQKGDFGWGLFFSEDYSNSTRFLNEKKPLVLGWLAKVPSADKCPTGHKYLRSPCGEDNFPIYLGGPISMANFDEVDRVICMKFISANEPNKNKMGVSKVPRRKISGGQEVLWSYNLSAADRLHPNFYPETEWQLDLCCTEIVQSGAFPKHVTPVFEMDADTDNTQSIKRRKVGGTRPLLKTAVITVFKPCTYCGVNIASALESGKKFNMKCHWALKHSVNLCLEMGADVDDVNNPVAAKDFIQHLDKVDHVFNTLNSHNYKVVPACKFFEITDTPVLPPDASTEEKAAVFNKFLDEGKSAFRKYQVVYLKGISFPQSYEDLLKPDRDYNYDNIGWKSEKPSGNNFSLARYPLSDDEKHAHTLDTRKHLINAVLGWM